MDQKKLEATLTVALSENLGLNMSDPNLKETPARIAKMWVKEFFSSVGKDGFNNLTSFPNDKDYTQIVLLDRIHFTSMCSHHFLPFTGLAWLAYIPNKKLVGASKPARLISWHSKKPQLQETLCHEVINNFNEVVKPLGTMVLMRGVHGCMSDRGVLQYNGSGMMTSAISGVFKSDPNAKSEALDMIKLSLMMKDL